jgi:hypothetical protein
VVARDICMAWFSIIGFRCLLSPYPISSTISLAELSIVLTFTTSLSYSNSISDGI